MSRPRLGSARLRQVAVVAGELGSAGWDFTFTEPLVSQLLVDHRFSMALLDGTVICLEGTFDLTIGGRTIRVPPGDEPSEVGAALPLFNQRIEHGRAEKTGEPHIRFSSGRTICVSPIPMYENWQLHGSGGELWVGLPGGGVAHWSAEHSGDSV